MNALCADVPLSLDLPFQFVFPGLLYSEYFLPSVCVLTNGFKSCVQ